MKRKCCMKVAILYLMTILMTGYNITAYATEVQETPVPTEDPKPQESEGEVVPEETPEPTTEEGNEQTPEETPEPTTEEDNEQTPEGTPEEPTTPATGNTEEQQPEDNGGQKEEVSPTPTADTRVTPSITPTPTADTEETEGEEELLSADGSFYYLKGTMRESGNCFVSDVVIYPTGKDGFTYIRQGEEGEFEELLVIDEDAIDRVITVQFYDGDRMTKPLELTYSRDVKQPYIEKVWGEKETLAENVILLATPQLYVIADDEEVWSEDGNKISGSGIETIYCRYDGIEEYYEPEDGVAAITLPESFYGTVEIWCKDKAGNESEVYSAVYLTDVTKPQINVNTRLTMPELEHDELLVEIMDPGDINAGIESVEYTLNGNVVLPELTISSKIVLQNNEVSDGMETSEVTIYSFIIQIAEENSELSIDVTDYAGNTQQCDYIISKEPKPEAYQIQLPDKLFLTIDPYQLMNDEQIVSEENYVVNKNDFPVTIKIVAFEYHVNKSNFPKGITPCELSMSITGEDPILLQEGISDDVIEVVLEPGEQRDICFYGSLAPDTEHLWRAGDIDIQFVCLFDKQRNLIVEKLVVDEENLAYEQETND